MTKIRRRLFKRIMAIPPCVICNVHFTSQAHEQQHYEGKGHKKKSSVAKNYQDSGQASSPYSFCDVCNVAYSSEIQQQQHVGGQKHINALKVKEELEQGLKLYCKFCDISFSNIKNKQEHEASENHKKKVSYKQKLNDSNIREGEMATKVTTPEVQMEVPENIKPIENLETTGS